MKLSTKDGSKTQLKAWIPTTLHYRLKVEAARRGRTMAELITDAIGGYLSNKPRRTNGHAQEPV